MRVAGDILSFNGAPELVKFNLLVSAAFLCIALLAFLFILLSRYRDAVRRQRQKITEEKALEYITSYLFEEVEQVLQPAAFREKYLINAARRQVFLNSLLLLHKNLIGETSEKLVQLYKALGLLQHSKQKLYASRWSKIAEGINELTEMGMQEEVGLIRSFINHPNAILRSVAQASLVQLDKKAPFSFLTQLSEPLQDWQQMQLARAAQKAHLPQVPDFSQWLNKSEESIVVFSIRMVVHFNQHQATHHLLQLLQVASAATRREVYEALRQLEAFEAAGLLMERYASETPENKREILKTLPAITFEQDIAAFAESLTIAQQSDAQAPVNRSSQAMAIS